MYRTLQDGMRFRSRRFLEAEFGLPVFVDKDANCFALGEKIFGEGKEFDHFVGATLGTGLGAGIIQNGRLLADANCGSGEFGEIPYMNGKLEDLCGSRFFTEVAGKSGYELSLEARSGNEEGKKMFDEYGWHLAYLVKIVVLTLDPQAIIFGGSIAKSFDLFKDAIFANLADFPYPKSTEKLTLLSSNKENSGIKQQPHNQDNETSENNPNPRTGLETDNAGLVLEKGIL